MSIVATCVNNCTPSWEVWHPLRESDLYVGAPAGQVEGYKYSASMTEKADGGLVWDEETLTAYLHKPKEVVPKTKMSFAGLRKDEEIENVIAYLKTFQ